MTTTIKHPSGTDRDDPETTTAPPAAAAPPRQVIGRFVEPVGSATTPGESVYRNGAATAATAKPPVAVFCHEGPDSFLGTHVARTVEALAQRGRKVHLFCRHPFTSGEPRVKIHQ